VRVLLYETYFFFLVEEDNIPLIDLLRLSRLKMMENQIISSSAFSCVFMIYRDDPKLSVVD